MSEVKPIMLTLKPIYAVKNSDRTCHDCCIYNLRNAYCRSIMKVMYGFDCAEGWVFKDSEWVLHEKDI